MQSSVIKGKKGTTTIFLAIILSMIILVECTYVSLVAGLDRRMTYTKAVKLQTESYLAQYDRELLRAYGIYAFDVSYLDDSIFRTVLSQNGIDEGAVLVVSGVEEFDTYDLRKVISEFYAYRGTGIVVTYVKDIVLNIIGSLDALGIENDLKEFLNSSVMEIVSSIIRGIKNVSDLIESLGIEIDDNEFTEGLELLFDLIDDYSHLNPDVDDSFNISNLSFFIDILYSVTDLFESESDVISDYLFHPFAVHYATYNFDSRLKDDATINGTDYKDIHGTNESDIEFILTGLTGESAQKRSSLYIYGVLFLSDVLKTCLDSAKMEEIELISAVLCLIVEALSGGALPIPPEAMTAIIIIIESLISADSELDDLINGEKVDMVDISDFPVISLGYRDFMAFFINFVSDETLLGRMTEIINRDYPDMVCGITCTCDTNKYHFEYEDSYEMYGDL